MIKEIKYKDYKLAISNRNLQELLMDNDYDVIQFKFVKANEDDNDFMKFKFNFVNVLLMNLSKAKISEKDVFKVTEDGLYYKDELLLKKTIATEGNIITEVYNRVKSL